MSLKACIECGAQVSSGAKACPHCGRKNPTGRWTLGAKLGLLLLVALLWTQSMGRESDNAVSSGPEVNGEGAVAVMPPNQRTLLTRFATSCEAFRNAKNEIQRSAVYRASNRHIANAGPIKDWVGRLRSISTNKGGSRATLVIDVDGASFWDRDVRLGSPVYESASRMAEGQHVVFAASALRDFNLTERGSVCDPDFEVSLTTIQ